MALLKAVMKTVRLAERAGTKAAEATGHVAGHFAKNKNGGMHFVNEYTRALAPGHISVGPTPHMRDSSMGNKFVQLGKESRPEEKRAYAQIDSKSGFASITHPSLGGKNETVYMSKADVNKLVSAQRAVRSSKAAELRAARVADRQVTPLAKHEEVTGKLKNAISATQQRIKELGKERYRNNDDTITKYQANLDKAKDLLKAHNANKKFATAATAGPQNAKARAQHFAALNATKKSARKLFLGGYQSF